MKLSLTAFLLLVLAYASIMQTAIAASAGEAAGASSIWVTAYYPSWEQQAYPPDKIDYKAFSDLIQFCILPTSTGEIDQSGPYAITPEMSEAVVSRAHAAGDKVLICVGGANSDPFFQEAITDTVRGKFIDNLADFATTRGYDGIDVDMEPVRDSDLANFRNFVLGLRAKLNSINPQLLLTAAAAPNPAVYAGIDSDFAQINIMTYDLSGSWSGQTWYNAPLYGEGGEVMAGKDGDPSAVQLVQRYIDAGIPKSKLGIGMAFYGNVFTGASGPSQSMVGVKVTVLSYHDIMDRYYSSGNYHWDSNAYAPYLSIVADAPNQSEFVTYDDARLCTEKVLYARQHELGGVTIFEIGGAYRGNQPQGSRDLLLQTVKHAWRMPMPTNVP